MQLIKYIQNSEKCNHNIIFNFISYFSSVNGRYPLEIEFSHHAGHGHNGTRKGLNIDFRYVDSTGKSFHGLNTSSSFDTIKNRKVYDLAYKYGFRKNYCTDVETVFGESVPGVSNVTNHVNHGHLGASDINLTEVTSI